MGEALLGATCFYFLPFALDLLCSQKQTHPGISLVDSGDATLLRSADVDHYFHFCRSLMLLLPVLAATAATSAC